MKVEVKPTENAVELAENLRARAEKVERCEDLLIVETDDPELLKRTPGVKEFRVKGEVKEGLGGKPVGEQAYARLDSREDAVRCLLATIEGYDLRVLETERVWDLRQLKRFNPDIKHLKVDEPRGILGIDLSLFDSESTEKIEIEVPEEEDMIKIYRELLT